MFEMYTVCVCYAKCINVVQIGEGFQYYVYMFRTRHVSALVYTMHDCRLCTLYVHHAHHIKG